MESGFCRRGCVEKRCLLKHFWMLVFLILKGNAILYEKSVRLKREDNG